jgi:hypothetical protein
MSLVLMAFIAANASLLIIGDVENRSTPMVAEIEQTAAR